MIRYLLTGLLALGCPLASRATPAIDLQAWAQSAATSEQALDAASLSQVQYRLLAEDTDPELRQGVINVLEQRIGWDVDALGYAWTIDMIARREGKPQRFGTLPAHAFPVALRGKERHQYAARQENLGLTRVPTSLSPNDAPPLAMAAVHPPRNMAQRNAWIALMQRDQTARQSGADLQAVDAANLPQLRALLREGGFPTREDVGLAGVEAAFVLVQHASTDRRLMLKVVKQVRPRAMRGEFSRVHLALLEDRIRLLYQQPQWYGTQRGRDVRGPFTYPIEQVEYVNARRHAMRLAPLSDDVAARMRWSQTR